MKIISLKAENIKKLVAVQIAPSGHVVKITGSNGAGKSSVMDSIWYALGGQESIPKQAVRKGQEKATIRLDLGDLIVERRFTPSGSVLYVENADGARFKSPQAILDGLVGRLSFDPLAFMRMDRRMQSDTLREMAGLDLSDLESRHATLYEKRTQMNREVDSLQAQVDVIKVPPNAPIEEIDPAEIVDTLNAALETNRQNAEKRRILEEEQNEIARMTAQLFELAEKMDKLTKARDLRQASLNHARTTMQDVVDVDVTEWRQKLVGLQQANAAARSYQQREKLEDRLMRVREETGNLTSEMKSISEQKAQRIREAQFPLDGLSVDGGVVLYQGIPLEQASSAEQLRVSLAMAMALNPKLRVIRITDGSLLDKESMAVVEQMATDSDFQVWIEQVEESGKVGVYIENGHVAAVNGEQTQEAANG
ncbi:MAG: AAA family ATPase [Sulfuricaulis sp.]